MANKTAKLFNISKYRKGNCYVYNGTLQELTTWFKYTLECGNSWNSQISIAPKTFKSLLSNLGKAVRETQESCFNQDCYAEASENDVEIAKKEGRYTLCSEY